MSDNLRSQGVKTLLIIIIQQLAPKQIQNFCLKQTQAYYDVIKINTKAESDSRLLGIQPE